MILEKYEQRIKEKVEYLIQKRFNTEYSDFLKTKPTLSESKEWIENKTSEIKNMSPNELLRYADDFHPISRIIITTDIYKQIKKYNKK